jgi:hypothetical protein
MLNLSAGKQITVKHVPNQETPIDEYMCPLLIAASCWLSTPCQLQKSDDVDGDHTGLKRCGLYYTDIGLEVLNTTAVSQPASKRSTFTHIGAEVKMCEPMQHTSNTSRGEKRSSILQHIYFPHASPDILNISFTLWFSDIYLLF